MYFYVSCHRFVNMENGRFSRRKSLNQVPKSPRRTELTFWDVAQQISRYHLDSSFWSNMCNMCEHYCVKKREWPWLKVWTTIFNREQRFPQNQKKTILFGNKPAIADAVLFDCSLQLAGPQIPISLFCVCTICLFMFFSCVFIRYDMFDKFPVLQLIALSKPCIDVCMFFPLFSAWPSVVVAVLHVPTGFQLLWPWGGIKRPCSLIKVFGSHFFYKRQHPLSLSRFAQLSGRKNNATIYARKQTQDALEEFAFASLLLFPAAIRRQYAPKHFLLMWQCL